MMDIFSDIKGTELWYHPIADRIFLFNKATFLMLPCLEREDGRKYICNHPYDVNADVQAKREKLIYIGEL